MSLLFKPGQIGNMTVKNRLFVQRLVMARQPWMGKCTDAVIDCYSQLAEGGSGLIITGAAYVHETARPAVFISLNNDKLIDGYKALTKAVHAYDARIVMQLFLPGRASFDNPLAPSPIKLDLTGITPRELTEEEIKEYIAAFGQAARRAREAGFDGSSFTRLTAI